jgi:hypothetical protein
MTFVTVAQSGLERMAFNHVVGGSNPSRDTFPYSLGVMTPGFHPGSPGSSPGMGIFLYSSVGRAIGC